MSGVAGCMALTKRDLVRFVRQPSRVVAAIGTPILIWIFAGSGLSRSFAPPTPEGAAAAVESSKAYAMYLVPGMATMVVLFASTMAAITLIQDRTSGFMQAVVAGPAPKWAMALGKALPNALLATVQGAVVLGLAWVLNPEHSLVGLPMGLAALALTSLGITGVALALASRIDSVAGFHGVMNLVLLPMWLLSGALFPPQGAQTWLSWIVRLNPMTWATDLVGASVGARHVTEAWAWPGTVAFALLGVALATAAVTRRIVKDGGARA
ncbi:MAG: ABC transporter permease [Phycisphaerales bacterium]|nr:ABC transporter permease [Phycisphaerales bacterium]